MRLPGTFNGKRGEWCRIVRADRSRLPVDPEAVRAALTDPEPPRPDNEPVRQGQWARQADDPLALICPPQYFLALCGVRVPDVGGAVRCPLPDHDDPYPSCQIYGEAEQGWWCFGCQRGGRVYDLGSLLVGGPWGSDLRGEAFRAARELVAAALG